MVMLGIKPRLQIHQLPMLDDIDIDMEAYGYGITQLGTGIGGV